MLDLKKIGLLTLLTTALITTTAFAMEHDDEIPELESIQLTSPSPSLPPLNSEQLISSEFVEKAHLYGIPDLLFLEKNDQPSSLHKESFLHKLKELEEELKETKECSEMREKEYLASLKRRPSIHIGDKKYYEAYSLEIQLEKEKKKLERYKEKKKEKKRKIETLEIMLGWNMTGSRGDSNRKNLEKWIEKSEEARKLAELGQGQVKRIEKEIIFFTRLMAIDPTGDGKEESKKID